MTILPEPDCLTQQLRVQIKTTEETGLPYPEVPAWALFLLLMDMERYGIIPDKHPREIVLLRGKGCVSRKCTFCDYYADAHPDPNANFLLNRQVLQRVTGRYRNLEVINSGSVFELDDRTLELIRSICAEKQIDTLHFEAHALYRRRIPALRELFPDVTLKMKLGLETFDPVLREQVLRKGIPEQTPEEIACGFQEANFLFGLNGQTEDSMRRDILLGCKFFERICINIMCENTTGVKPDPSVIHTFAERIYPQIKDDPRIDILMENTDFGVGGVKYAQ